ncbi:alpha/beta fold hydrolase [Acholeplasma equirhinis]|uniref:alpha/beta fold hydrolase n=1 Tax=Acholeplasma equirhinis TaxID=555393 RepID=UPI00197AF575|nr:alpha/beta fold hydrolase [Acholeplasma equirhinis]MBN3490289.1 alpha/beta fold hydrolase [Acholeplasma equirhinis]
MLINQSMIYTENQTVTKAKATVIITHGIALHSVYYRKLADLLNEGGYNVVLYDVRGHGKSQGKRGDIKSVFNFTDDLYQLVLDTKKSFDLPVYLLGHSMGGIITNLYSTLHDDYDGSIILASPTEPTSLGPFNVIPYQLFGFLKFKTDFNDDRLSHFPPSDNLDPYALKYFTLRLTGNIMRTGIKLLNKNVDKIKKPILIVHGTEDKLVDYSQSQNFMKKLGNIDKTLKLIDGGYHNLQHDTVTEEVAQTIIDWLNKQVKK